MKSLAQPLLVVMGVAFMFALATTPLMAQTALPDPPLFIGNSTCPNSSCANLFNGETIGIPATSLTIFDQGDNSKTQGFTDPTIELIIAIPNPGTGAPGISSVAVGGGASGTPVGVLGGGPFFGGTWNGTTGAAASTLSATSPPPGSVYTVAGLPTGSGGASSDNFSNFAAWDNGTGLASVNPTTGFFGVFVYTITGVSLTKNQYLTVDFSGTGLPLGTFAAAFSCMSPDSTAIACSGGDIFSTPFTHVGLVNTVVPEPTSMLLMGSGLLGLGGMLRRRKKVSA